MFQAEMRDMIAQREQEMIVAIVAGAKQFARFSHQIDHLLLVFGAHIQSGFAVGDHVKFMMDGFARRREVNDPIKLSGNDGRVHKQIQRNRLE